MDFVYCNVRYSIPEEMPEGSFVGNIAKDLGIEISRLISGKARVVTKGGRQYVDLSRDKGTLVVKERIDREELCKQTTPCSFSFDLIVENPIQLHRVTVEVQDINDNAPLFPKENVYLKIAENAVLGARFPLDSAIDADVGLNDAVKQKLTVVVEDNGQPSRSAVVSINVAVADSFPEVLSEFTDFTHEKQYNDNLTFYLVLALAAVSFLFITCVVVIISVKIYRWRQSRFLYQSNLPVIPYYPPHYADTGVTGTLPHGYNYEVCMTTDSRKSDCKFSTLGGQNVLVVDPSFTETMQRAIQEKNILENSELHEMVRGLHE
ncbi:Protocadherin beta-1 [Anabarilius grahami]|uniref:Protocadherin beta-1 n=1 Tax=Anabarilius grahami TaxID=495550 RepID=A0A3N0Z7M5_ANAGA|nr:Protocadherin beta-1 [Anabarilius grahami]